MANGDRQQTKSGMGDAWLLAGLGDWFEEPPPPLMPPAPAVDQRAWTESLNAYHPAGGDETVARIGGIINAETQGMKDRKDENEPLLAAREKIAQVRINGIKKFGSKVQQRRKMTPAKMSGPDFPASVDAARLAAIDDVLGIDPTHAATHYNMRTDSQSARGGPLKGKYPPSTKSGPYQSPTRYDWVWTYRK